MFHYPPEISCRKDGMITNFKSYRNYFSVFQIKLSKHCVAEMLQIKLRPLMNSKSESRCRFPQNIYTLTADFFCQDLKESVADLELTSLIQRWPCLSRKLCNLVATLGQFPSNQQTASDGKTLQKSRALPVAAMDDARS
jgi:hypothetical protein